eukprot:Sspe_Gene.42214::Locus_20491_Transcript_1_1_Confidence_1.000_Length_1605::g.42214::m.42214/K00889/PIP5K; 1-phosphatidylinositol-4-phosphate 5-kinase
MAACFKIFYDTSALQWEEAVLADAIIKTSQAADRYPEVTQDNPLTESDFRREDTLSEFVTNTGLLLQVTEYAPRVFRHYREDPCFGNNITAASWQKSWTDTKNQPAKGAEGTGKSGATFIPSMDKRYLIKTIDAKEVGVQMSTLRDYIEHFRRFPHSLLMRHLQLLRIEEVTEKKKVQKAKYLLVCESATDALSQSNYKIEMWDLKGRTPKPGKLPQRNRPHNKSVGKDTDLLRDFRLTQHTMEGVLSQIHHDVMYLSQHQLMDYSMLISVLRLNTPLDQRKLICQMYNDDTGLPHQVMEELYLSPRKRAEWRKQEATAATLPYDKLQCVYPLRHKAHKYHGGVVSSDGTEIYFFCIIDCLTNYHSLKKLANCCKKFVFFESQLSTIPAADYGQRFYNFMRRVITSRGRSVAYLPAISHVDGKLTDEHREAFAIIRQHIPRNNKPEEVEMPELSS